MGLFGNSVILAIFDILDNTVIFDNSAISDIFDRFDNINCGNKFKMLREKNDYMVLIST
jgi:hypothetical protein